MKMQRYSNETITSKQRVASSSLAGIAIFKSATVLALRPFSMHRFGTRSFTYVHSNSLFFTGVFGENPGNVLGLIPVNSDTPLCQSCGNFPCACPFRGAA